MDELMGHHAAQAADRPAGPCRGSNTGPAPQTANVPLLQQIGLHLPRMYRVACRLLADADKAHDVVQDACVKALAKGDGFDGRASVATWLHRITVNCARDAIRGDGRRTNKHQAFQASGFHAAGSSAEHSPADMAERRELADMAWALLEELPEDCRSAFALTQLDGYSYDEAAEIENQPRGTMASRVFRAKKLLLEQMNSRMGGPHHEQ